jgi:hypothetical protein
MISSHPLPVTGSGRYIRRTLGTRRRIVRCIRSMGQPASTLHTHRLWKASDLDSETWGLVDPDLQAAGSSFAFCLDTLWLSLENTMGIEHTISISSGSCSIVLPHPLSTL